MTSKIALSAAVGLILAGCDSYSPSQYQSSPSNVIALQSIAATGKTASVGTVTVAEGVNARPTCRLAGPIDVGGGVDIATAVKQALQAEFLAGDIYSASGIPINVEITELKPDSVVGQWTLGLKVDSAKGAGFNTRTIHKFTTSFSAAAACNNTADAFNRALASGLNKIVTDPRFRNLL
ncbi:hypothetical protein [uncultured Ruegeria sp.]|uniref:hypothetical protein n=1 Tax=uncultured Ruegeria sp. TaxID=259304 RepID=UPI00262F7F95|nr:hypothetical protein [uncultured Ruegeria sp.]